MSPKVQRDARATEANGIPLRNVWLLMLYASDLFRMRGTDLLNVEEMPDELPDVIAELLAHAVEERLRRNLHRAYEPRKAILDRVRGTIDLLGTESRQLIRQGKVACRYEDLTIDTLRNRTLNSRGKRGSFRTPRLQRPLHDRGRPAGLRLGFAH